MTDRLALPRRYRDQLEALLREHVPGVEVWAYGSRVNGRSHDGSDLDLVLRGPALEPLDGGFYDLLRAIEKSNVPFLVQAHDWTMLPESFHREIERGYVVVQQGAKEKHRPRNGWRMAIVAEIAEKVAMGPFGSSIKVETFVPEGIPIISGKHLHGFRVDDSPGFNFITDEHAERLANANVQRGDIVFTHAGNIGQAAYISEESEFERYVISQRQFYMRCDRTKAIPEFVAMYFKSHEGQHQLLANASQVGVPSIAQPVTYLRTIEIPLPSLPEQRAIAHVLGTLDDKIELNRRMNATLEAMAQALFKSWFVDFDPVRAKMEGRWRREESLPGLPVEHYDLFPDRLVGSELGETPEGWEVKALGELVELAYGKALRAIDRKDGPVPVYGSNGQVGWHDKKLVGGPGIVVGRKGNPGVVTWAHSDFFPIDTTFYVVPRDANGGLPFLFFALTGQDLPSVSADSAVPGLNRNLAYMNQQLVPDKRVLAEFNAYASAIFSHQHQLEEECHSLATQRNALLPKLVSGEVQVREINSLVG